MKKLFVTLLVCMLAFNAFAEEKGYKFTDGKLIKTTSVKNQFRSGTCWCYSALSWLENEIMRAGGEEMDLSEMWIVRNIYFEKAVKYVRLHGALNFAVGGAFHDVTEGIKKYGIVPQEVYQGLNYGTELPHFNEIDAVLKAYVDAIIKNPNKTLTTAWQAGLNGILDAYFGKMPETFEYKGKSYTPQSFAASLPIKMEDYVCLSSFTHHPFYKTFVIEVPDNWMWASVYNVPLEEMMAVVDNALANDYSIGWASDVSEKGFNRKGLGLVPDYDQLIAKQHEVGSDQARWVGAAPSSRPEEIAFVAPCPELDITVEMRQQGYDNYTTTDDHGMHIYGIAKDQTGKKYYMVKNSWGITGDYDGIWYVSEAFVRYKTMDIMVNRNAIPAEISAKINW